MYSFSQSARDRRVRPPDRLLPQRDAQGVVEHRLLDRVLELEHELAWPDKVGRDELDDERDDDGVEERAGDGASRKNKGKRRRPRGAVREGVLDNAAVSREWDAQVYGLGEEFVSSETRRASRRRHDFVARGARRGKLGDVLLHARDDVVHARFGFDRHT